MGHLSCESSAFGLTTVRMIVSSPVARVVAMLCLSFALVDPAVAQEPPTRDPSAVARERIERAIATQDLGPALAGYEQLRAKDTSHRQVLGSIAFARMNQLRKDPDPRIRADACAAVLQTGAHRECTDELTTMANDGSLDAGSRLAAASALRAANVVGADRIFEFVLGAAIEQSPASAADGLARLPASVSREPLKRLAADSSNADARYIATMALARMRGEDLLPVLRSVSSDKGAGAARLAADIGLAANGDRDALKLLNELLPHIRGRERVEAALALITLKDPRGPALLAEAATGEYEILRIEAAEAMYPTQRPAAERALNEGLASGNPWVRARAIRALTTLQIATTPPVRRAMLDKNSTVAVAAARAAMLEAISPRQ